MLGAIKERVQFRLGPSANGLLQLEKIVSRLPTQQHGKLKPPQQWQAASAGRGDPNRRGQSPGTRAVDCRKLRLDLGQPLLQQQLAGSGLYPCVGSTVRHPSPIAGVRWGLRGAASG